jgi:hypothetical protein
MRHPDYREQHARTYMLHHDSSGRCIGLPDAGRILADLASLRPC